MENKSSIGKKILELTFKIWYIIHMAEFRHIFEKTLANEGGYVLHEVPGDKGGMTYAGISRRHWPDWEGWKYIDVDMGSFHHSAQRCVEKFYHLKFWSLVGGNLIDYDSIAYSIYDFAVNVGVKTAVKMIQKCLGVKADGVMGPITLSYINSELDPDILMTEFSRRKEDRYIAICRKDPTQLKFLQGWINRTRRVHDGK